MGQTTESYGNKPEVITDWKGNIVKVGDEVCLIKIKDIKPQSEIWYPGFAGVEGVHTVGVVQEREETDCFEVLWYAEVIEVRGEPGIMVTMNNSPYPDTLRDVLMWYLDSRHVLGIKGVSDFKQ
jgi:hypothetical protein